jgi:hypothetical protein
MGCPETLTARRILNTNITYDKMGRERVTQPARIQGGVKTTVSLLECFA